MSKLKAYFFQYFQKISKIKKKISFTTKRKSQNKKKELDPITIELLEKIPITSTMQVKHIMVPRIDVISLPIDISFENLFLILKKYSHSRIPIYHKVLDDIIGILYTKDLLYFLYELILQKINISTINFENELKKIMRAPLFIPESTKALNLLRDFQRSHSHIAIVVDEYGGFSGIISLEDILEEIVGDIQDEYDDNEIIPSIFKISDRNFVVDAKTSIKEINDLLNANLPIHNDIDTIGGFILELFGYLPKKNDKISYFNLKFKILKTQKNRIDKLALYISKNENKNLLNNLSKDKPLF